MACASGWYNWIPQSVVFLHSKCLRCSVVLVYYLQFFYFTVARCRKVATKIETRCCTVDVCKHCPGSCLLTRPTLRWTTCHVIGQAHFDRRSRRQLFLLLWTILLVFGATNLIHLDFISLTSAWADRDNADDSDSEQYTVIVSNYWLLWKPISKLDCLFYPELYRPLLSTQSGGISGVAHSRGDAVSPLGSQ